MYPEPFAVHFLSFLPHPERLRLLDAGSGAGRNSLLFAQHRCRVVALDKAHGMLTSTQREVQAGGHDLSGATLATVACLPFGDSSFDAVVCASVFEYLSTEEAPQAAAELQRVLRPRGMLLLVCAAQEGSELQLSSAAYAAHLTGKAQLLGWMDHSQVVELLHVRLELPASSPVRAQWVLIARRSE